MHPVHEAGAATSRDLDQVAGWMAPGDAGSGWRVSRDRVCDHADLLVLQWGATPSAVDLLELAQDPVFARAAATQLSGPASELIVARSLEDALGEDERAHGQAPPSGSWTR